jgi:hypothetical protein
VITVTENIRDATEQRTMPKGKGPGAFVLAAFLPAAAALLMVGEVLTPKGVDKPTTTLASALKALTVGAGHSSQVYFSNMLVIFGLGALGVSFAAIATLATRRDAGIATAAAVIGGTAAFCGALANMVVGFNLAAAATAHTTPAAAAQVLVSGATSAMSNILLAAYLGGGLVAIVLTGIALWRSNVVPRWLPVLFGVGLVVAATSRPGLTAAVVQFPFAVAMVILATRIWDRARTAPAALVPGMDNAL